MKWKLICMDVDGTLLNDEKQVPAEAAESLRTASAAGLQVALVSGRMLAALEPIERELGIPCIKACSAGTYIVRDGVCLSSVYLPVRALREMTALGRELGIPLWIYREKEWYVTAVDEYVEREAEIIRREPVCRDGDELADQWEKAKTGPNKLLFGARPEIIREISSRLKDGRWPDMEAARSADIYLEIFPRGMDKGRALEIICEKLGIAPGQTLAFGDQELDLPMIRAAGAGIAMGNAIDRLREEADYVTASNNEGGISQALRHFLPELKLPPA